MERVGEQQKLFDETGLGRSEHGGLPASVGMPAEKDAAREAIFHDINCGSEAGLVPFRASAWRRSVRPRLPEREIAAENGEAGCAERVRKRGEKRGFTVRSRAVGQYKTIRTGGYRTVEKSANRYSIYRSVEEFLTAIHI